MSVTHSTVVVVPDDPAFPVGSDEWNASHTGTIDDTMHGSRGAALHTDSHSNINDPAAGEKAALAGTSGTPGAGNKYVTDADSRNADARTPLAHAHAHAATTGQTANDHHAQLHASAHQPGGGDAMAVDAAAATGSLRTLGTGAAQAAAGNDSRLTDARTPTSHASTHTTGADKVATGTPDGTKFLRDDFAWTVPPAVTLLEGFYDPGTMTVETEHFAIHRDHLKLTSTERLTLEGTSRVYERDLGENSYGPQGELADRGYVILGTPKTPSMSFLVPTDYQYQLLNRLQLRGTMRASLVGTADLYIENDAPQGGRIAITGRGVNTSG